MIRFVLIIFISVTLELSIGKFIAPIEGIIERSAEIEAGIVFELRTTRFPTNTSIITYSLGKRAEGKPKSSYFTTKFMNPLILGDRVVASHDENQQWTVPQNRTQTLTYPKNGIGANVTYVEIIVDQVINSLKLLVTNCLKLCK